MALIVNATDPDRLLASLLTATLMGNIKTWRFDAMKGFTYAVDPYQDKGWFSPIVKYPKRLLIFKFLGEEDVQTEKEIYGIYHGRCVKMLLNHFEGHFSKACASSKPQKGVDVIPLGYSFEAEAWM